VIVEEAKAHPGLQGCSAERKEGISHQDIKDKDHSSAILAATKSL
jgi:hypothetical protein